MEIQEAKYTYWELYVYFTNIYLSIDIYTPLISVLISYITMGVDILSYNYR